MGSRAAVSSRLTPLFVERSSVAAAVSAFRCTCCSRCCFASLLDSFSLHNRLSSSFPSSSLSPFLSSSTSSSSPLPFSSSSSELPSTSLPLPLASVPSSLRVRIPSRTLSSSSCLLSASVAALQQRDSSSLAAPLSLQGDSAAAAAEQLSVAAAAAAKSRFETGAEAAPSAAAAAATSSTAPPSRATAPDPPTATAAASAAKTSEDQTAAAATAAASGTRTSEGRAVATATAAAATAGASAAKTSEDRAAAAATAAATAAASGTKTSEDRIAAAAATAAATATKTSEDQTAAAAIFATKTSEERTAATRATAAAGGTKTSEHRPAAAAAICARKTSEDRRAAAAASATKTPHVRDGSDTFNERLSRLLETGGAARMRNFCIIAHVDHGKTTLSDRLLELTEAIPLGSKAQILDSLEVEMVRGITVKSQACSLLYYHGKKKEDFLLNLIDTPGHRDFEYEVERSFSACNGAVLLVDCLRGIQAQTTAHFNRALSSHLCILPAINKVDSAAAKEQLSQTMESLKALSSSFVHAPIPLSAKTGFNVDLLLQRICECLPPPAAAAAATAGLEFRARIIDSWFSAAKGVVLLVLLEKGSLHTGAVVYAAAAAARREKSISVKEVGVLRPHMHALPSLYAGQVGYIVSDIRHAETSWVGETLHRRCLQGRREQQQQQFLLPAAAAATSSLCTIFAGIYPTRSSDYEKLRTAMGKLLLTDAAAAAEGETSAALGHGFRCGFSGALHLDIFRQRLKTEHDVEVLLTPPSVVYRVLLRNSKTKQQICSAAAFPDYFSLVEEPMDTKKQI